MKKDKVTALIRALRPNQWVKNLILFSAIIFTGKLFDSYLFLLTSIAFIIFCAISSASYLFNDLIDLKYDRIHPEKKHRPLASGLLSPNLATETAFLLGLFGLIASLFLSAGFFLVTLAFSLLHLLYSTVLKKYAILDILSISFSFTLRALAGEILTGYHLPIWLLLSIFFVSLFIASTKRHSEFIKEGASTRPTLFQYKEHLLDFYTSTFATASILSYALFTFLEEPPRFEGPLKEFLMVTFPNALDRKWMIITIPFIVFCLMRYAQLIYEGQEGEKPEKIITTDKPLILAMLSWGVIVIVFLYIL
ncbi:UbiA prenyltransferase family protein [Candidatus Gottesmanbacteria bacterium]|nr:UbiA prenyltransferase family protein [Candidatus Gottesmanbacteria bacterium]